VFPSTVGGTGQCWCVTKAEDISVILLSDMVQSSIFSYRFQSWILPNGPLARDGSSLFHR